MKQELIMKNSWDHVSILNKTMSQIVEDYLYEKYTNKSTIENYKRYLTKYFNFLNIQSIQDINIPYAELRLQTANFIHSFKSDATKRLVIASLNEFYKYFIEVYHFPKSPVPSIRLKPRPNKSNTPSATKNEIAKLLKKLYDWRNFSRTDHLLFALIYTLATTGLRISECLQITKNMVQKGELQIVQKRGTIRTMEIPTETQSILKEFFSKYESSSQFVFTGKNHKQLLRQNAYKYIRQNTKKYGCHSFRKSVIEILLEQGYHSHSVAKVSGHASINMIFYYDTRSNKAEIHKKLSTIYNNSL
ncbi:MAG TPA: site-specific integrase [Planctomycetota bacterium]|nr:site-specific integrase [Planctomycetota bacterium]HQB00320.1 site-specific integrase [Planctomycetota bacterium]